MKTFIKISLILFLLFGINTQFSNADETTWANTPAATGWKTIEVTVTEKIPGVECTAQKKEYSSDETGQDYTWVDGEDELVPTTRYRCEVPIGWTAFLAVLGRMIRFMTWAAILSAVLFLVFNGIRLSMSGVDGEAKWKVKSQIMMTLGGIILLLLSGPILKLIAPWVYT